MRRPAGIRPRRRSESGVAAVEFAFIAIPFFLLLFGIIEVGRLMYVWNTVQEVTRNAAREAVVTDFTDTEAIAAIKRRAVFRLTDGALPAASEVSTTNVVIRYLNALGGAPGTMPAGPGDNLSACGAPSRLADCIRTVEVCISTGTSCASSELIAFVPMTGLFKGPSATGADFTVLRIPLSSTRMPAESLGFRPDL
jgi:Flp pilus assembly protein TadG